MRRPWALPLVPFYAAGLAAKNAWLDHGYGVRQLAWPVISVGSLSAGGAGKTPVVLMLADLLTRHGLPVDILSRGYGRGSGAIEAVDPTGSARRSPRKSSYHRPRTLCRQATCHRLPADATRQGRAAEPISA